MKIRSLKLDEGLKVFFVVGFLLIVVSTTYSFFYLPYKKEHSFKQCLKISEDNLTRKQQEINSQINILQEKKIVAQKKESEELEEFLENNPEPISMGGAGVSREDFQIRDIKIKKYREWLENKSNILSPMNEIREQMQNLEDDLEITKEERKTEDDTCYKKFK